MWANWAWQFILDLRTANGIFFSFKILHTTSLVILIIFVQFTEETGINNNISQKGGSRHICHRNICCLCIDWWCVVIYCRINDPGAQSCFSLCNLSNLGGFCNHCAHFTALGKTHASESCAGIYRFHTKQSLVSWFQWLECRYLQR